MDRKKFIKKSILGLGTIAAVPTIIGCSSNDDPIDNNTNSSNGCKPSPTETAGPFPIKTPADLVKENIVGSKKGIALLIKFVIQNTSNNCNPLSGVYVDLWHCDAKGNYSEYNEQLDGDFTSEHFLRGRQETNANGEVSFISVYPGWYPGRAPHLHLEIKEKSGKSLLVTQVAFPEDISTTVYKNGDYKGNSDTSNASDNEFRDSLQENMADSVTGDTTKGYTLTKVIKVKA